MEEAHVNSWEYRNAHAIEELIKWYELLHNDKQPSERVEAQIQMLAAVLYLLLPPKEYKKLTQLRTDPDKLTLL